MPKRVNAPSTRSGCGTKKAAPNEPQANGWVIDERHAARGAPHVLPQRFAAVDRTRASHSNNRAYAGSQSSHQLRCGHVRILPQRAHGGSSAICTAHDSGGSEGARAAARSCAWRSSPVMVHRRVSVGERLRSAVKARGVRVCICRSLLTACLSFASSRSRATK